MGTVRTIIFPTVTPGCVLGRSGGGGGASVRGWADFTHRPKRHEPLLPGHALTLQIKQLPSIKPSRAREATWR